MTGAEGNADPKAGWANLSPEPDGREMPATPTTSKLRLCRMQRILMLRGPVRATISAEGVRAEAGRVVDASKETCVAPVVSRLQGGLLTRGAAFKQ